MLLASVAQAPAVRVKRRKTLDCVCVCVCVPCGGIVCVRLTAINVGLTLIWLSLSNHCIGRTAATNRPVAVRPLHSSKCAVIPTTMNRRPAQHRCRPFECATLKDCTNHMLMPIADHLLSPGLLCAAYRHSCLPMHIVHRKCPNRNRHAIKVPAMLTLMLAWMIKMRLPQVWASMERHVLCYGCACAHLFVRISEPRNMRATAFAFPHMEHHFVVVAVCASSTARFGITHC